MKDREKNKKDEEKKKAQREKEAKKEKEKELKKQAKEKGQTDKTLYFDEGLLLYLYINTLIFCYFHIFFSFINLIF